MLSLSVPTVLAQVCSTLASSSHFAFVTQRSTVCLCCTVRFVCCSKVTWRVSTSVHFIYIYADMSHCTGLGYASEHDISDNFSGDGSLLVD